MRPGELASRWFYCLIFVFHLPGVIERVIGGVPNQVPERPGAGHFVLGMQRPAIALRSRAEGLWQRLTKLEQAFIQGQVE
jgi:hypothetical protein